MELVFGVSSGSIVAVGLDGQVLDYFPVETGIGITGSPTLADIDSDGDIEILIGANTTLFGIDVKESSEINEGWAMHRGNYLRNGSFEPSYNYSLGDLNGDLSLDILDIVLLTNLILDQDYSPEDSLIADINGDSVLDILDIILLINLILI